MFTMFISVLGAYEKNNSLSARMTDDCSVGTKSFSTVFQSSQDGGESMLIMDCMELYAVKTRIRDLMVRIWKRGTGLVPIFSNCKLVNKLRSCGNNKTKMRVICHILIVWTAVCFESIYMESFCFRKMVFIVLRLLSKDSTCSRTSKRTSL